MPDNIKEKRLKMLLDQFCADTQEGFWIKTLNPSNIEVSFVDLYKDDESFLIFDTIHMDPDHDAKHLFPYYIKELWKIYCKRTYGWRYWLIRIFNFTQFNKKLKEKQDLAEHWLYS